MIIDEMISSGHARALLAIKDRELQVETATQIFDNKLSVRETEKLIKKLISPRKEKKHRRDIKHDPVILSLQKNIEEILGTKVSIAAKRNKGKIEIEYFPMMSWRGLWIYYSKSDMNRRVAMEHIFHSLRVSKMN